MANPQKTKKLGRKQQQVIQEFYEAALNDPHIHELIAEAGKYPEMTKDYYTAMENIFVALDTMCQAKLKASITVEPKK